MEVPSPAPPGYDPLEPRIGGDSVSQIYLQLICKYKGKELPETEIFLERAPSIFERKSRILLRMEERSSSTIGRGAKVRVGAGLWTGPSLSRPKRARTIQRIVSMLSSKVLGAMAAIALTFPSLLFLKETTALDLGPTYPLINHGVQLTCTDRPLL